ncbi:hypothetical protein DYB26_002106 [Aphanomyces astaci]|uniref:Uncharacterized protein n=1 Tax=Aphanomyces astaci TaxID=112090 RepID=A0A418FLA3_APHAT|nr:hypothetical protein DYB26_002106 [Aphanomyces astaci]
MSCLNVMAMSSDVNRVAKAFERSSKMVNYTDFCHELQQYMEEHAKSKGESSDSHTTAGKSRQTARQSCSTDAATDDQSESSDHSRSRTGKSKRAADSDDLTKRTIRVDHRLEQHRVLKSSIRQKILRGVRKPAKGGFDGVRDLLLTQDSAGDGTLDESVFVGTLEEEASTSGDDDRNDVAASPSARPRAWGPPSPANKRQLDRPHLGSDVLTVERNLKQFMTQRVPKGGGTATCCHHLATVKHRQHLKTILQRLATDPDRDNAALLAHFRHQLEKIDARVTGVPTGVVSKKGLIKTIFCKRIHQYNNFLACLTSHHSPMRWPKQDTEACLALFIDPSKASKHKDIRVVHYPEFLRYK